MANAVAANAPVAPTFAELRGLVYAAIKIHPDTVTDEDSREWILLGALDAVDGDDAAGAEHEASEATDAAIGTEDENSYMAAYSAFCDYADAHA